jgi:DNA N-6-adenine-methyltransferase (Dam)
MPYEGNGADGKHYWLTPPDLYNELNEEFHFDFDPCPYPMPWDFDGLREEWGQSNYVNPPFKGPTAWVRKAIAEHHKGKRVVFVFPVDKWVLMLLEAGAQVRNLKDVKWCATEDGLPGKGTGRHIAMFILEPPPEP